MKLGMIRRCAVIAAMIFSGVLVSSEAARAACDISNPRPTVTAAYNKAAYDALIKEKKTDAEAINGAKLIELNDVVVVKGENFGKLFDAECASKKVTLFLNGLPMIGIAVKPPTDPSGKELNFTLRRADAELNTWLPILGSPAGARSVTVSVGFADSFAMAGTSGAALPQLEFSIVPTARLLLWAVAFLILVALFAGFAKRSNIIRDPVPAEPTTLGTYSLARAQGAWWFFIILATYLFIGIVTGDFNNSFNGTALALIGIGAGTVIGSAVIDAQKDTAQNKQETAKAITETETKLNQAPADQAILVPQLKKLRGESENFITDILSDANGISFHRFQIFAWTLVLSMIFVFEVYANLAMPTFNQTLLGMMGVSVGTYLGLKIPEPTTPTKKP